MKRVLSLVSAILFFSFNICAQQKQEEKRLNIDLYLEPFNSNSWQSYVYLDLLSRKVKMNLKVYPYITKNDNGWITYYGDVELKEIARLQALIEKYPMKLNDYLRVRVINMSLDGWKDALIYAGINPIEFDDFVDKNKSSLLDKAFKNIMENNIKEPGIYIESKHFGGFSKMTDLMEKINSFLPQQKQLKLYSKELSNIKPPRFIVVSDEETKGWIDANIIASFKNMFGDLHEEKINLADLETKIKDRLLYLPAYLIEKKSHVVEYLSVALKQQIVDDLIDYYVYYDVRNMAKLLKRTFEFRKLEVFIMSQCPFGVKAIESLINYIEAGKIDKTNIAVHYIGDVYQNADGSYVFNSLHGEDEWKEDMRQVVIFKYYPEKYWQYMKSRIKNYSSNDWQTSLKEAGIDQQDFEKKLEKEGKRLLAEDFKLASSLKINVSPTFIVNGSNLVVGISNLRKVEGYEDIKIDLNNSGGCGK